MGSTRQTLVSTTSTAAIETIAAAPSAPCVAANAAIASPTSGSEKINENDTPQHATSRVDRTLRRAVHAASSLLHPSAGRLAHDETRVHSIALVRALRPSTCRAVKNLRIVASAVLLLNFREVRDSHLCSTSAAR